MIKQQGNKHRPFFFENMPTAVTKPVRIRLTVSGQAVKLEIRPVCLFNHSRRSPGFGMEPETGIDIVGTTASVRLLMTNNRERDQLSKLLRAGEAPELTVSSAIESLRLVVFERGWPDETQRTTYYEAKRSESGVRSFENTVNLNAIEKVAVRFLGHQPTYVRRVAFVPNGVKCSAQIVRKNVFIQYRDRTVDKRVVSMLSTEKAAEELGAAISDGKVAMIEPNDVVRGFAVANREGGYGMYGNLHPEEIVALRDAGGVMHTPNVQITAHQADTYEGHEYLKLPRKLAEVSGLGALGWGVPEGTSAKNVRW